MDKHDFAHHIKLYLLFTNSKLNVGEASKEGYDTFFKITKTKPIGEVCAYCGRDEFKIDEEGYGPCGCK